MRSIICSFLIVGLGIFVGIGVRAMEIRVAIIDRSSNQITHTNIQIQSAEPMTVIDLGTKQEYTVGSSFDVTTNDASIVLHSEDATLQFTSPLRVQAADQHRLQVTSLVRGDSDPFHPSYRGLLEVDICDDGRLRLINQVSLEEYVYGVVPSEIPVSWPIEALKAQAIASRTYVVAAVYNSPYIEQGFHLDDSFFWQTYNNRHEAPVVHQAVDSTQGIVMVEPVADTLIQAFFHSTSAGVTANAADVWSHRWDHFPASEISYLQAQVVAKGPLELNLTSEIEASKFLLDPTISSYDDESPWFRWSVVLTRLELEAIISQNLAVQHRIQPEFVRTETIDGQFESLPIPCQGIGTLLDLEVVQRGRGGNIMVLQITGTTGRYQIGKEWNIRSLLRPSSVYTGGTDIVLIRKGSSVANHPVLPSAFAVFDIERDAAGEIIHIGIYGGGSGHGVGMSQWGARGMALAGYSSRDILATFYPEVRFIDVDDRKAAL